MATLFSDLLTHCCLVDLTDVALAFEDDNSKLLDVVIVADVAMQRNVLTTFWSRF